MKDTIKMVISHFFIITVCVMTAIGLCNIFLPGFHGYDRFFPLHMLFIGASTALPSFLFYFRKEPTRGQFLLRVVLHFFCIITVVLGEGYILKWFESIAEMAVVTAIVLLVYLTVWIITRLSSSKVEQGINEALKNFNGDGGK